MFTDITDKKATYNKSVLHPLQSFEWGEFRKKTGVRVVRRGMPENREFENSYTFTIHKVPKTNFTIGYLPKSVMPTQQMLTDVLEIGKKYNCVYIQLEPDALSTQKPEIETLSRSFTIHKSFHPLFTPHTFMLDITASEEDLLAAMHPKTRYNIRVAQKHNVTVRENTTQEGFDTFLKLYEETTTRQRFYAHTPSYHKHLFETLTQENKLDVNSLPRQMRIKAGQKLAANSLSYHIMEAVYREQVLTSWVLFAFHKNLYYPYGASSRDHREVMSNNLIMWEVIKFGKKHKLENLDMWGALGENPDPTDPWFGFHKFKQGYGARLTEFIGSYDLVLNPAVYQGLRVADKARWAVLRLKKRF